MQKNNTLKITVFPFFIKKMVDDGVITLESLVNPDKASTILSKNIVAKLKALNSFTVVTKDDDKFVRLMNLDWLKGYSNNSYMTDCKVMPQTFFTALFEDGAEESVKDVSAMLHGFSLTFTSEYVSEKEYAIFLDELKPVEHPDDRRSSMLNSMRGLLNVISIYNREDVYTKESVYTDYVKLLGSK